MKKKKKTLISIEILTRSSVEVNSWVDRQESLIPSKQKKFKTNNCLSERISHSEASNTRKCVHKLKIENITHFQWFIIDKEKTTKLNKPIKGKKAKPTYIFFGLP